jgi:hypothetical protein
MKLGLLDVFHGRKNMVIALAVSVIVLLAIEMVIFIAMVASSGEQSRIEVRDKSGKLIYNVTGTTLSHMNFSYFERKYGDLDNYDVEVKTISKPFPVRAWISASIGVPLVLILLTSYLVKVYLILLQGEEHPNTGNYPAIQGRMHPFIAWSLFLSSSSIFFMGTIIAGIAVVFWMVPDVLGELADFSAATLMKNSRLLQGTAVFTACLALWVVYLRYRLSRRMMDYQYRLEKQRLDQHFHQHEQLTPGRADSIVESRGEP